MSNKKSSYSEIDDIREDLDSLKTNVIELTKHVKQDGVIHTSELKDTISDRWSQLQASGREKYKNVESRIKEKPGQSMAVAFAAGLAASVLLRRR